MAWLQSLGKSKDTVQNVVRKASGKRPTDKALGEVQRTLMDTLYYGLMKKVSKRNAGNTYSFGFKQGTDRPKFTARGAYLWRREINESNLFALKYYDGCNNITTASLTSMHLGQDRDLFISALCDNLLEHQEICTEEIEKDDRGRVLDVKSEDEYWQIYLDMAILMPIYFFDQKDVTYFLDHFYRALFKLIAMERLTQDGPIKEGLRENLENELFFKAQTSFYPLNVATYTHVRNILPERITRRMSSVNLKVKKMNQQDYVSPIEQARQASLR